MRTASAVAVIVQDEKVLLLERAPGDYAFPGWCLPGGHIESGETPEEACLRELGEETGLTGKIIGTLPDRLAHSKNGSYDIKVFRVELDDPKAKVVLSHEHSRYQWLEFVDALTNWQLAGNATRSIVTELRIPRHVLYWPLLGYQPMFPDEIGMFGVERRHEHHSGIDLYCELGTKIIAVEDGEVIAIEHFTGPLSTPTSPWWNPTQAVLVKGKNGVAVYGEITALVEVGQKVRGGEVIGIVNKPVLRHFKGRPTVMMHFEWLEIWATKSETWPLNELCPDTLLSPGMILCLAAGCVAPSKFDLSKYDGKKFNDPTSLHKASPWWAVWGGAPDLLLMLDA